MSDYIVNPIKKVSEFTYQKNLWFLGGSQLKKITLYVMTNLPSYFGHLWEEKIFQYHFHIACLKSRVTSYQKLTFGLTDCQNGSQLSSNSASKFWQMGLIESSFGQGNSLKNIILYYWLEIAIWIARLFLSRQQKISHSTLLFHWNKIWKRITHSFHQGNLLEDQC